MAAEKAAWNPRRSKPSRYAGERRAREGASPATLRTSRTRPSTSTASSPGSTSTTGCCSSPRTRRCRCSSASSSARSGSRTSTSSTWSGSPTCTTRSTPGVDARGADGMSASEQLRAIRETVIAQRERSSAAVDRELRPPLAEHGIRLDLARGASTRRSAPSSTELFRAPGLPGADAARDRAGPAVPLHLQPLAQPRRRPARPRPGRRGPRPREGPEGAARPLPLGRRRRDTPWCRSRT